MVFTLTNLIKTFGLHWAYIKMLRELNISHMREPNFPEAISENIIKFFLIKHKKHTVTWECTKGDLLSDEEGKIECKCFTSKGPISFTPSSDWNVIYFLDARNWFEHKFIIYRLGWSMKSSEWQNLEINKNKEPKTFGGQIKTGRRPRICWNDLHPQISSSCEKVFEGNFQGIYQLHEPQLEPKLHSPPTCTDDNQQSSVEVCNSEETPEN